MPFEVNVHFPGLAVVVDLLREVLSEARESNVRLLGVQRRLHLMPTKQDFDTLLAAVNTATNKIAARIQALIDKLASGGLTPAEEAEVQAGLAAAVAQLEALGADPENPVPA